MRASYVLLACLLLAAICAACVVAEPPITGSGIRASVSPAVGEFDTVHFATAGSIEVRVGEPFELNLSGDDDLLPLVRTRVTGSQLVIEMEPGNYRFREKLRVTLGVPELVAFQLAGSGQAHVGELSGGAFAAELSGSGNLELTGELDRLDALLSGSGRLSLEGLRVASASLQISGSGDVAAYATGELRCAIPGSGNLMARGEVSRLEATISGSGSMDLSELRARSAVLSIRGSGSMAVLVEEDIDYSISGSGNIRYSGNPAVIQGQVSGSGSVGKLP